MREKEDAMRRRTACGIFFMAATLFAPGGARAGEGVRRVAAADEPLRRLVEEDWALQEKRRGRDVAVITCLPMTPFDFQAGQYVNVESPYHPRNWRPYSLANAPRRDGTVDLHVRADPGSWVSASRMPSASFRKRAPSSCRR